MTRDYRDLVIEALADDEAAWKEAHRQMVALVASLDQDVASYRELAQLAIHELAHQRCEYRRVCAQRDRLRERLRDGHA